MRTVTTVRELAEMPIGTIIRDHTGNVYERIQPSDHTHRGWVTMGSELDAHHKEFELPATVLYRHTLSRQAQVCPSGEAPTGIVAHEDPEPPRTTARVDCEGSDWSWNGWEWDCVIDGVLYCLKQWEEIPKYLFPMTRAE